MDLGGYIPCPDHRIAPDAKWENVKHYCARMLETIPLFIREGAIIPMGPVMNFVGEKPLDAIELLVTPCSGREA